MTVRKNMPKNNINSCIKYIRKVKPAVKRLIPAVLIILSVSLPVLQGCAHHSENKGAGSDIRTGESASAGDLPLQKDTAEEKTHDASGAGTEEADGEHNTQDQAQNPETEAGFHGSGTQSAGQDPAQKPLGDTGKPFVNDYDASDRSYAASDNYISPKDGRSYGETTAVSYYSSTLGTMRNADVILPYGYDPLRSYPVLYMLHGMGGSNRSWSDMGVKYIVQNLHYENNVPDMIVVCVDCFISKADQSEVAFSEMSRAYDKVEDELINDLMPYINAYYSTKTGRDNTAIAGYSLGGRGALAIGFKHQDMFGYIGAFSAASGVIPNPSGRSPLSARIPDFVLEYGDFPMILINIGETDGICGNACRFYDEALTARGIKHIFYEMEGDHEGTVWQNGLYNFVKRIF